MQQIWQKTGHASTDLKANLFFLGAVLTGEAETDEYKLMAQAAPLTAVMFHNLADEVGAMAGANLPQGPLSNLVADAVVLGGECHDPNALQLPAQCLCPLRP